MKVKLNNFLTALLASALLAAGPCALPAAAADPAAAQKQTLLKLMKHEEELDLALLKLHRAARLSPRELQALGLTLKHIARGLDEAADLNKAQLAAGQPRRRGPADYPAAIHDYSARLELKAGKAAGLAAAGRDQGQELRDAVSSRRGARAGRSLEQVLARQDASKSLLKDALRLSRAARGLKASGKWLDLASRR
jgi:hypothetical protein